MDNKLPYFLKVFFSDLSLARPTQKVFETKNDNVPYYALTAEQELLCVMGTMRSGLFHKRIKITTRNILERVSCSWFRSCTVQNLSKTRKRRLFANARQNFNRFEAKWKIFKMFWQIPHQLCKESQNRSINIAQRVETWNDKNLTFLCIK